MGNNEKAQQVTGEKKKDIKKFSSQRSSPPLQTRSCRSVLFLRLGGEVDPRTEDRRIVIHKMRAPRVGRAAPPPLARRPG